MSVLDLPINKQMELAKKYNMSLRDWQTHIRSVLQETDSAFLEIKPQPNFDKQRAYHFTEMTNQPIAMRLARKMKNVDVGKYLYLDRKNHKAIEKMG